MTLVESALCPLDTKESKKPGITYQSHFNYYDKNGKKKQATTKVTSAYGLSPHDEFYLWGLLALTFAQSEPSPNLNATPHYCLTQLGVLKRQSGKGGKNYKNFRDALERLAGTVYSCDAFYDPIRAERSFQTFQFLSLVRPINPKSSRVWRIIWNQLFFEYVTAGSGHFSFDLATYSQLDPASGRLFLLLRKMFHKRRRVHFSVKDLAVHQLGYSASRENKKLKASVKECFAKLLNLKIISLGPSNSVAELFEIKSKAGEWVTLYRGEYFEKVPSKKTPQLVDSPAKGPLVNIGFEYGEISRLLSNYSLPLVQEWADITLAAKERFGLSFFKKGPKAYFRDNLKHAASSSRTAPDWWTEIRREEERRCQAAVNTELLAQLHPESNNSQDEESQQGEGRARYTELVSLAFGEYLDSGQTEAEARSNAEAYAKRRMKADQKKPVLKRKPFPLSRMT